MSTYILTIYAKSGHEDAVAELFQGQQAELEQAEGFRGRQVYQAQTGLFLEAVKSVYTEEQISKLAAAEAAAGAAAPPSNRVQFVVIEDWEKPEQRVQYSSQREGLGSEFMAQLVTHILPEHSHEFYQQR
jgi:quinol monooxygenase YgiN